MILLAVASAWLLGAALGALGWTELWPVAMLAGAGVCLGWLLAGRRREALFLGVALLASLISLARYQAAVPSDDPGGVAAYNRTEDVRLFGVIDSEPEEAERSQRFTVDLAAVQVAGSWRALDGKVLVTARVFPTYAYGDAVDMTATLQTPPVFEGFDYREYLARRGVTSTALFPSIAVTGSGYGDDLKRALIDLRAPLGEALERTLPEPESALARGILLGQRASIPDDTMEEFNASGLSHLIAISGYNVMLVAGFVTGALSWLTGRRPATVVAMAAVLCYAAFVGGEPSVLRAAAMAQVMLGATLAGRPGNAITGVLLAGAVLTAWQPLIVEDVSFQLSFAATLGIVLAASPIRERLQAWLAPLVPAGAAAFLAEQTAVTASASIAVLPIIAGNFGRFSLVSLPANLLAAPVFALALAGSAVTALVGAVDTGAGRQVGELAFVPLTYLVELAHLAASLPLASLSVDGFGLIEVVAAYGGIAVSAYLLLRQRPEEAEPSPRFHLRPVPAMSLLMLALSLFAWSSAIPSGDIRLRVTVLDVGQGDAIFIETPAGHRILVDGGPSGARLAQALGEAMPPNERRIDLVVLTHPQDDHVTGLVEVLQRYDVGAVLRGPSPGETAASRAFADEVERQGLPVQVAETGQWLGLGTDVMLEVLAPLPVAIEGSKDDLNNNAVVLRLTLGQVSFLLTGDIEAEAEVALLESGLDLSATVLKVAHHGSDGSSLPEFLGAVSPSLGVISVGEENGFGHPSPSMRLRFSGTPLLRTDNNGGVSLETDGDSLWVDFERGDYEYSTVAGVR